MRTIMLVVGLIGLTSLAPAAEMSCGGLVMQFDAGGRVTGLRAGERSVLDPAGVAASGFAIWDHGRGEGFVGFPTHMHQTRRGWRFLGEHEGLRLSADFAATGNGYAVTANLRRLSGPDRFVSVRFGLPVDVHGWRWWRTINRSLSMKVGRDRQNGTRSSLGTGFTDIMPMAAASGAGVTLGYTVPLDRQLLHATTYDGTLRNVGITFDFAMCEAVPRHAERVNFAFELFAPPDPLGMRAIVAEYFALYPQWGESECGPGGWCAWGDIGQHQPPLYDFGLLYHEGPTAAGSATCAALGIRDLPYIEPSMYQQFHGDLEQAPSTDQAWERLRHSAEAPLAQITSASDSETHRRWVQAISQGILNGPVCGPDGQPIAPNPGNWSWIGGSNYGAQFPLNLCPGVPRGVGQERLEEVVGMTAGKPATGQYLDSYSAWLTTLDYSTANLNASRFPPSFDGENRPVTILALPAMEWVDEMRTLLSPEQQCILPNCYSINAPFPWHQFDVIGKEHWVEPVGDMMANCRAVGLHKTVTQLPAYEDQDGVWLKRLLLYDVFPGGYANRGTEIPEGALRAEYRRLIPPLRLLHELQWQPLTRVTCAEADVLVERYGQGPGPVAVVAVNNGPGRQVALEVDAAGTGLPWGAWCQDPLGESSFNWSWAGDKLVISTWLGEGDTALCVIADQTSQRRLWELWAQDRLNDINLCMREYAMRNGKAHELAAQAAGLDVQAKPAAVTALREFARQMPDADPVLGRAGELAVDAAARLSAAIAGQAVAATPVKAPEGATMPSPGGSMAQLPWTEEFNAPLDPEVWTLEPSSGVCQVRDGKLWMELKTAKIVTAECLKTFSLAGGPLEFEFSFHYSHGGGWWYLGNFIRLDFGGDYILIRVDDAAKVRLENAWTAASGYTQPIVDYMPIAPNVPHVLRLALDRDRYKLFVDDKLLATGEHDVEVGPAIRLTISQYSGHQGHGDVGQVDAVKVRRLPAAAMK